MEYQVLFLEQKTTDERGSLMNMTNDQTEIQTICLYREPVNFGEENFYFATDYFDFLVAKKRESSDTFCSIMNLSNETSAESETAAQSFTLYFGQDMYEEYESTKDCEYKQSPFEEKSGFNFLSITQVHIMPEVLRRMEYKEGVPTSSNGIVLKPFLDDLYEIVNDFAKSYGNDEMVFRIYEVLSAGDFAVVIRSKHPKTSFELSSSIRKRVAGVKKTDKKLIASEWAMYKTFTLLTIKKELSDEMIDYNDDGKFVIRGCYSCKYWANHEKIQEKIQNKFSMPTIAGLNGRYDFILELSEKDFYEIYQFIVTYKKGKEKIPDNSWKDVKGNGKYLVYLLENDCIAWVNERYLLPQINLGGEEHLKEKSNISGHVVIDTDLKDIEDLTTESIRQIDKLKERYKLLDINEILVVQQNTEQYFRLLERHILSCYGLNQQSDTRGFVRGILNLLDTVIGSIEAYWEFYKDADQKNKIQIAEMMVDYIRESVYAIDNYMEHIRNNNMQSLQTPNYDIESNMGMEKILVGYGEYLSKIIRFYRKRQDEEPQKTYYPIIVPDLQKPDICVEVLFPEGGACDWGHEQEYRKKNNQYSYLLIIGSPTISELGDMPVFMAMLFHEIAHQFRYEERSERNPVVAHMIIKEKMEQLAMEIMQEMRDDFIGSFIGMDIQEILTQALKECCMGWADKDILQDSDLKEAPLSYFDPYFLGKLQLFMLTWSNQNDVDAGCRRFLMKLQSYVNIYDEKYSTYLKTLSESLKSEETVEIVQVEKAAFALIIKCAYELQYSDKEQVIPLDEERIVQWLKKEQNPKFREFWKQFGFDESEQNIKIIYNLFNEFASWLENESYTRQLENTKNTSKIITDIYNCACEKWNQKNKKYNSMGTDAEGNNGLNDYRAFTIMGRKLGIDNCTEDNKKMFGNLLYMHCKDIDSKSTYAVQIYREVKSDMFMYSIMDLSPFAYLNVVTMIISNPDLVRQFNIERMVTVLCVMETGKKNDNGEQNINVEQILSVYWEMCRKILEGLKVYYVKLMEANGNEEIKKTFCAILGRWEGSSENQKFWNVKKLAELITEQKNQNKNLDIWKKLEHIEKTVNVFERLILNGRKYILKLIRNKECYEDYQTGVAYLKGVKDGIRKNMGSDPFMKKLLLICEQSKRYIEQEHYETGIVKDAELNKQSIEFLLSLYYDKRIRNTRKEENKDEN